MNGFKQSERLLNRSSFDYRICDDLCEVLLNYLSFEEKIHFECVSKQFQRCVYVKQNILEVTERDHKNMKNKINKLLLKSEIDLIAFEKVVKKCKNINNIIIGYELNETADKVLQLITENCHFLKYIELDFNNIKDKTLIKFGKCFENQLKSIEFLRRDTNKNYKNVLNSCSNLLSLSAVKLSDIIGGDYEVFMSKLNKISLICLNSEILMSDKFFTQYHKRVQRFGVISGLNNNLDENSIDILMKQISSLDQLQELHLEFNFVKVFYQLFDENMKTIAKNCPKIRRLSIHSIINNSLYGLQIFQSINYFKGLKYLNLNVYHTQCNCSNGGIGVAALKDCKQLTNLILNYPKLNDSVFENIQLYLPALKCITIYANNITDNTMHSLSKLKNLTAFQLIGLRLNLNFPLVTDLGIIEILNNCPKIKSIRFNRRPNITIKTIHALIEKAINNPKICFSFDFGSSTQDLYEMVFDSYKTLPKNIEIKF